MAENDSCDKHLIVKGSCPFGFSCVFPFHPFLTLEPSHRGSAATAYTGSASTYPFGAFDILPHVGSLSIKNMATATGVRLPHMNSRGTQEVHQSGIRGQNHMHTIMFQTIWMDFLLVGRSSLQEIPLPRDLLSLPIKPKISRIRLYFLFGGAHNGEKIRQ